MSKHKYNYANLVSSLEYNKLLDITSEYNNNFQDKKSCMYAYIYRIDALITFGRFDEAMELCFESMDKTENEMYLQHIYHFLSAIYYFKKDYIMSLYYNSLSVDKEERFLNYRTIVEGLACNSTNEEIANRLTIVDKDILEKHIKIRHAGAFNDESDVIFRLIRKNFYKAPTYYDFFSKYKIFRCSSIGNIHSLDLHYSKTTDIKNQNIKNQFFLSDYIKVIFKNEHPHSILTSYPVESNGDLSYYDLSEEYFKTTDSRYNTFSVRSRRLERVNKFEARQSKKIN